MTTTTPPGWYPDGVANGQLRYWDGQSWTSHTAPQSPPTTADALMPDYEPPSAVTSMMATTNVVPPSMKIAMFGGLAGLVGSFLPWISVLSIFGTIELSGFDGGDGKLTAGAAIGAMLLGYFGLINRTAGSVILAVVAAFAGLAVSIYDLVTVSNKVGDASSEVAKASVGYGLYVCVAGFGVCAFGLLKARKESSAH